MPAALGSWKLGPGDLLVFVPWPTPWASYHLRSPVYFSPLLPYATAGKQRFVPKWSGPRLFEAARVPREKFLEQSYTHLCSIRPWCMRSCWISLHVVHSVECLHVVISAQIAFGFICEVLKLLLMEKYSCMDMLLLRGGHVIVFQVKVLQVTLVRQLVDNVSEGFTFCLLPKIEVSSARSRESLYTSCSSTVVGSCRTGCPFFFCRCAACGGLEGLGGTRDARSSSSMA